MKYYTAVNVNESAAHDSTNPDLKTYCLIRKKVSGEYVPQNNCMYLRLSKTPSKHRRMDWKHFAFM